MSSSLQRLEYRAVAAERQVREKYGVLYDLHRDATARILQKWGATKGQRSSVEGIKAQIEKAFRVAAGLDE